MGLGRWTGSGAGSASEATQGSCCHSCAVGLFKPQRPEPRAGWVALGWSGWSSSAPLHPPGASRSA